MATVSILAGWAADRIIARGFDAVKVRKAFTIAGFLIASTELIGAHGASTDVALFFAVLLAQRPWPGHPQLLGPDPDADPVGLDRRIVGIQNAAASAAGIVAPILTGWLVERTGKYDAPMQTVLFFLILGVAAYLFLVREKYALNRMTSQGDKPNQVVIDPTGKIAATVNYTTGNLVAYRVLPDGRLSDLIYADQHTAPGGSPHAHGIIFTKDSRHMFVAELGLDRVYSYDVDPAKGTIVPAATPFVSVHAGAGPRRLQLSQDGRHLYVNHETDGEVSVFEVHGSDLKEIQTAPTLPPSVTVANKTAEIVIDPAGRHLYVGNRGHDTIAVFNIALDGRLTLTTNVPAGGKTPRNLRFDPTGRFLLSANEGDGSITVFKVDPKTGALTLTPFSAKLDTPGGLYFLAPKR
jgi:6-phosphogluconolactonase